MITIPWPSWSMEVVTPQTQPWCVGVGLGLVHKYMSGKERGHLLFTRVGVSSVTQAPGHQESARGQNKGQREGVMMRVGNFHSMKEGTLQLLEVFNSSTDCFVRQ